MLCVFWAVGLQCIHSSSIMNSQKIVLPLGILKGFRSVARPCVYCSGPPLSSVVKWVTFLMLNYRGLEQKFFQVLAIHRIITTVMVDKTVCYSTSATSQEGIRGSSVWLIQNSTPPPSKSHQQKIWSLHT